MSLTQYFPQGLATSKRAATYFPLRFLIAAFVCLDMMLILGSFSVVESLHSSIANQGSQTVELSYFGLVTAILAVVVLVITGTYTRRLQNDAQLENRDFPVALLASASCVAIVAFLLESQAGILSDSLHLSAYSILLSIALALCVAWPVRSHSIARIRARIRAGRLATSRAILLQELIPDAGNAGAGDAIDGLNSCGINVERVELIRLDDTAHCNDVARMLRGIAEQMRPKQRFDAVVVSIDGDNETRWEEFRRALGLLPVPVYDLIKNPVSEHSVGTDEISTPPAEVFLLRSGKLFPGDLFGKRFFDVILSALLLLFLMPLLAVVAAAIKLDSPGPILFRQTRRGLRGQNFTILKFRTMNVIENGSVIRQATRNDSRVTRLGSFLRRTSIDELPQLINILLGHMSLVGPRPHAIAHDEYYGSRISSYTRRQHVKPGLTGWAQVCGYRGATPHLQDMINRVDHDNWYISNWSLLLDLKIIIKTALLIIHDRKAY